MTFEVFELNSINSNFITSRGTALDVSGWYKFNDKYYYIDSSNCVHLRNESEYNDALYGQPVSQSVVERVSASIQTSIAPKMNTFNSMIALLENKFNYNRPVYTQYLNFQVKIGGEWVTLVNTISKEWTENCLVSFNNKLTGAGVANTFTLDILFKQNDRNLQNIYDLEAKLLSACDIVVKKDENSNEEFVELTEIAYNCKFQYGYGDDTDLRGPMYVGRIMGYTCDLNGGQLQYNITGFGGIYSLKEIRLTTKPEYQPQTTTSPLKYIENIFNAEFGDSGEFKGMYKLKILVNNPDELVSSDPQFTQFTNKNFFEIIKDILAGTTTNTQHNELNNGSSYVPNQQVLFSYYLDSAVGEDTTDDFAGTIYIFKVPSQYDEEEELIAQSDVTFNYFGASNSGYNSIVKNFKPQYDGSILTALATTIKTSGLKYQTMDQDGNIIDVFGMGAARLGTTTNSSTIFNTVQEYSKWSAITQYTYKASMTTLGIPCEAPITGLINVKALMISSEGEKYEHHTSGLYMILGKTDTINASGFFSEFELFKLTKTTPKGFKTELEDENNNDIEDNGPQFVGPPRPTVEQPFINVENKYLKRALLG